MGKPPPLSAEYLYSEARAAAPARRELLVLREGTQATPGNPPTAGGAVVPSPWGAVHSLRAEACWEISIFTRPVQVPETPPSLQDQPEARPWLGGVSVRPARGTGSGCGRRWVPVQNSYQRCSSGRRDGEGLLQGWSRRQPASSPPPPTARAHTRAQTCTHTQTGVHTHADVHTRRQTCTHTHRTRRACPRPQLLHCDLRVITALPPAPFLWDTRVWAHTRPHTLTLAGPRRPAPTTSELTRNVPSTSLPVNLHTSAHGCICSWGTVAGSPGPRESEENPHPPSSILSLGWTPHVSQVPGGAPSSVPLPSFPRKCHFGQGEVVCERHADLASIALKLGFLVCKAGMQAVTGRVWRGRRP